MIMSSDGKERVSALMDGEIGDYHQRSHVIDRLTVEPSLRAVWERYHLISDVLRNNLAEVAMARAGEPAMTRGAGMRDPNTPAQVENSRICVHRLSDRVHQAVAIEPISLQTRRRRDIWGRPVAGFALAASVAMMAIIGIRYFDYPPAQPPTLAENKSSQDNLPSVHAQLNHYLVNYSEYLDNGMRGMLPYARIASYDVHN
jgi:sigma-E factor negative regulatory protein RseA